MNTEIIGDAQWKDNDEFSNKGCICEILLLAQQNENFGAFLLLDSAVRWHGSTAETLVTRNHQGKVLLKTRV